jgi:hypothetical protein
MYRRACASLVALCAAGASERWLAQRARRLISNGLPPSSPRRAYATFGCAAPARCGAFVDARRIAAGDEEV